MNHTLGRLVDLPVDAALGAERFSPLLAEYVVEFKRPLKLGALAEIIDKCIERFGDENHAGAKTMSDRWLAPRLHAALRLTKREAATHEIWTFLAAYAFPDYVAWRWGRARQLALSDAHDVKKHPFKRLWWGAEMFRNGESYEAVDIAFRRSDVANTSLSTRIMNNRSVALAVLKYMEEYNIGSRQVNPISTQLRTAAVTVALDVACPNYAESTEIDEDWLRALVNADEVIGNPVGPRHGYASEEEIQQAMDMLVRVIDIQKVRDYRRSTEIEDGES